MFETHRLSYRLIERIPLRVSIAKGMTRVRRRLIEDFLLPALNDRRYGDRLKWEDEEKNCFSIRWSHKNAAKWSLEDTVVFQDWDRMKGHFRPDCKGYYMQAKQRFRAALYKLATVRVLKSDDKHVKKYELVLENGKRKHLDNNMSKVRNKKFCPIVEAGQRSIPTSVICRNDSYYDRQFSYDRIPQSVRTSAKSEYSDHSNDDSLEFTDNSNPVKQEMPDESNVAEFAEHPINYCFSKPIDSNFSGYTHNTIIAKPTNNYYEMVQIKSEPIDKDFEMVPIKCEPADNLVMVPVNYVCELDFSEASPPEEEPVSEDQKWRTMQPKPEKASITESNVEPKVTDEMKKAFTPKLRAKYVGERSNIFHDGKTELIQSEVPILSKQFVPKVENLPNSFSQVGFLASDEKCPILSKVENSVVSFSKTTSVSTSNRTNPHVPIPPLPGYSKNSIAVKPLDSHLRRVITKQIRNKCTENKFMFGNQDKWSDSEPALSADGALNLCTKYYNRQNEKYSCADR